MDPIAHEDMKYIEKSWKVQKDKEKIISTDFWDSLI